MANRKQRARRGRLIGLALHGLSFLAQRLPLSAARAAGAAMGELGWLVLRRYRRRAMTHIEIAFPDWTLQKRRATVRAMFHHLGQSILELAWMPNLNRARLAATTEIHGAEHLDAALAGGRGALIFTGHCGNWEWLGATVTLLGHPMAVMQRERDEEELNRFIIELREKVGMRTIGRGSNAGALEIFRTLRSGALLAFLIDQNIRTESVKVPFFGKPALTPIGPARLAVRAQAPVMICFIERRSGKQIVRFEPPRPTARDDDPVAITTYLTEKIEEQVRRAPDQWVWFHPRWRERPEWEVPLTAAAGSSK